MSREAFAKFVGGARLLSKLSHLRLVPMSSEVLLGSIEYFFERGTHVTDALLTS